MPQWNHIIEKISATLKCFLFTINNMKMQISKNMKRKDFNYELLLKSSLFTTYTALVAAFIFFY